MFDQKEYERLAMRHAKNELTDDERHRFGELYRSRHEPSPTQPTTPIQYGDQARLEQQQAFDEAVEADRQKHVIPKRPQPTVKECETRLFEARQNLQKAWGEEKEAERALPKAVEAAKAAETRLFQARRTRAHFADQERLFTQELQQARTRDDK